MLVDAAFDHIAHAAPGLTSDAIVPLLKSFLGPNDQTLTLDLTQQAMIVDALYERYGDKVASALEAALPALQSSHSAAEMLRVCGAHALTPALARAILQQYGYTTPSAADVAGLLGALLASPAAGGPVANMAALAEACLALAPSLDAGAAVRGLDALPEFALVPSAAVGVGLGAFLQGCGDKATQALGGLWGVWQHRLRQLQLLYSLVLLQDASSSLATMAPRRIIDVGDLGAAPEAVQAQAQAAAASPWNALDLLETLMQLAGSTPGAEDSLEVGRAVTAILERAIQSHAECVLLGLAALPPSTNAAHHELLTKLLAMFLSGHPAHQLVFYRLAREHKAMLLEALQRLYHDSALQLPRIVEVLQEEHLLDEVLTAPPYTLGLDAAAYLARRDELNLETWLHDLLQHAPAEDHVVGVALQFLETKIKEDLERRDPQAEPTFVPLSVQQVATFLRVLRSHGDGMAPEDIEHFKVVRNLCLQLHPRLLSLTPGSEDAEPGLSVTTFSKDVHREADAWYRQMYEGKVSVDDIIALLKRCKHSDDAHDHQLFACMVHTLFDEYRWFELYYPPRELLMTSVVFGSLIREQLVDSIPLGIAIRYVVDALRAPPNSPMSHFGARALVRFWTRLSEWPQLCQALISMPTLQQAHPQLVYLAEKALEDAKSGVKRAPASVFPSVRPDVRAEAPRAPSEAVSDQVLFLLNNLTASNVDEKLRAAQALIEPGMAPWLARYVVLERVSLEPNNHVLYRTFLLGLGVAELPALLLQETLHRVKALLEADKTMQSSSERTLLKNLAAWLGLTTLALDRPLLHRHIAVKELLLEAHDVGRLMVAIPFVCKVLEQCSHSRVFRPPNPWVLGVLRLLVELYQYADLKLNLKFEIEVLCKGLHVDLSQLAPSCLMKGRRPAPPPSHAGDYSQLVAHFEQLGVEAPAAAAAAAAAGAAAPSVAAAPVAAGAAATYQDMFVTMLQNMAQYIVISPQIVPYANSAAWKRVMYVALERAIQEIITPVIERSVTIASISTRELVSKDFAMEPDEHKLRTAAHQMAQSMAGSLALVTCKEPLRLSILAHARQLFAAAGVSEQALPEPALQMLVQDNLDLACVVMEKTAMEKALLKVDEGLAGAYAARREYAAHGRGAVFWDQSALSPYSTTLPDLLRIAPPGLQPAQWRVYEQLAMAPAAPRADDEPDDEPAPGDAPPARLFERFVQIAAELERYLDADARLDTLPPGHAVRQLAPHLGSLVLHASQREETALLLAQKIVQLLYKASTPLGRDVWLALLQQVWMQAPGVAKEVHAWLLYAEDERKLDVPVTLALLEAHLVSVRDEDQQLAQLLLRSPARASVLEFATRLVRELLQRGLASRAQLAGVLGALHQAAAYGHAPRATQALLDGTDDAPDLTRPLREQFAYSFCHWVRVLQHAAQPDTALLEYVRQLQSQNVLKGENVASLFFRTCTEVSVGAYVQQALVGGSRAAGLCACLDGYARLVVALVRYHADPSGASDEHAKVHYLTKVLSIFVLVLAHQHEERGDAFAQTPFFRFVSSVLFDLHAAADTLHGAYHGALLAVAQALHTLQPRFFPRFAFAWLGLVSHRRFWPPLLAAPGGREALQRLLVAHLRFLAPLLRESPLLDTTRTLYTATLRVLLVLLHDAPEFLAEAAAGLADAMPPACLQLRNMVLCAYPRTMRLPDPLAALPPSAIPDAPPLAQLYDARALLHGSPAVLAALDDAARAHADAAACRTVADACAHVFASDAPPREPWANALVWCAVRAALAGPHHLLRSGTSRDGTFELVRHVLRELEPEGRYVLLSAAANQLRFPSRHTAYASMLLLALYSDEDTPVREQILRVLLERLIVHRPHPWGVVYTLAQLLRLPKVPLPHAPPEITAILEHMAQALAPDRPVPAAA